MVKLPSPVLFFFSLAAGFLGLSARPWQARNIPRGERERGARSRQCEDRHASANAPTPASLSLADPPHASWGRDQRDRRRLIPPPRNARGGWHSVSAANDVP